MRISDWSSDVVSSDLGYSSPSWLLTEVGIKDSRNCSDEDISGFALYYGLDQTQLLRMYRYGSVTGARWRGNFFRFKEHYVRSEERRVGKEWVSTCRSRVKTCP